MENSNRITGIQNFFQAPCLGRQKYPKRCSVDASIARRSGYYAVSDGALIVNTGTEAMRTTFSVTDPRSNFFHPE